MKDSVYASVLKDIKHLPINYSETRTCNIKGFCTLSAHLHDKYPQE